MNVGISVNNNQKPKLWPTCDTVIAHTGIDVKMDFQGVEDNFLHEKIKRTQFNIFGFSRFKICVNEFICIIENHMYLCGKKL